MDGMVAINQRLRLSVVIPIYNEEACLDALLQRVSAVCRAHFSTSYEIILVNDGSSDASWSMIATAADRDQHIVGVNLSRNHGHQLALSSGLEVSTGEIIFILDADLQDPPELLPHMLAKMQEGYDVVYGQRISRAGESRFKLLTARLFYRVLQRMVDISIPRDTGDFRLISRRVLDHLNTMPERFRFIRGMISWIGFPQTAFPYHRDSRLAGTTHYPLRKMISFALDAVTSFSILPLRFASHLGVMLGITGLASLGWVGWSYISAGAIAGWTSLAALILIMGSIQLMLLGIFGEYLGRMYMETKQRPLFFIQEIRRNVAGMPEENPVHRMNEHLRREISRKPAA